MCTESEQNLREREQGEQQLQLQLATGPIQ